jgi:hypothetical protein
VIEAFHRPGQAIGKIVGIIAIVVLIAATIAIVRSFFRDESAKPRKTTQPPTAEGTEEYGPSQQRAEGPLEMSIPAKWTLQYRAKSDLYAVSTQVNGSGLLMFGKLPPRGKPGDIPALVRNLADRFVSHNLALASEKYDIESFASDHSQGSCAVFRMGRADTNLVQVMFLMSVDGELWSGQFGGESEHWRQALDVLKTVRKTAQASGSGSSDTSNGRKVMRQ